MKGSVCAQAYAWGGNEYGQCGVQLDQRDVLTPQPCVPHLRVTQVAAGGMHSCVLTDAGEVAALLLKCCVSLHLCKLRLSPRALDSGYVTRGRLHCFIYP